jgi:hypothetical protein
MQASIYLINNKENAFENNDLHKHAMERKEEEK